VLLFMVSICANEKFIYSGRSFTGVALVLISLILTISNSNGGPVEGFSNYFIRLRLYQTDCGLIFLTFILYLVLCLVRVVRIRKLEAGPLVKRL